MATTSLNLLHIPFSPSAPSFPSRQLPNHLPLRSPINNANSLVCKAKECYNVEVVIEEDEPAELCMRYFEREVSRAGIPQEWRRRKFHENKKEERKRKAQDRARLRRRWISLSLSLMHCLGEGDFVPLVVRNYVYR